MSDDLERQRKARAEAIDRVYDRLEELFPEMAKGGAKSRGPSADPLDRARERLRSHPEPESPGREPEVS